MEKEYMLSGRLYDPNDKELVELRIKAHRLSNEYNMTPENRGLFVCKFQPDHIGYVSGEDRQQCFHRSECFHSDAASSAQMAGPELFLPKGRRADRS